MPHRFNILSLLIVVAVVIMNTNRNNDDDETIVLRVQLHDLMCSFRYLRIKLLLNSLEIYVKLRRTLDQLYIDLNPPTLLFANKKTKTLLLWKVKDIIAETVEIHDEQTSLMRL